MKEYIDGKDPRDVIERANILKKFYNGRAGEIFKAIINGLITVDLSYNEKNMSEARLLGRCEGYQKVLNMVELAINEGDSLQETIIDDEDE